MFTFEEDGETTTKNLHKGDSLMTEFPIIHTNVWDAVWAIPVIMIVIIVLKVLLSISSKHIPVSATVIGMIISIFISHPQNLSAGIFMGFFYSAAAIGTFASLKTTLQAYRS